MNIAFDMAFSKTGSNKRGIGRYSNNMIHSIMNIKKGNQYFFFSPENVHSKYDLKIRIQQFIGYYKIDLFHITSPFDYLFEMEKEWFGPTKVAVTLYDVIPLVFPDKYLPSIFQELRYKRILDFIQTCDVIFAISETTKQDAVKYVGIDKNKMKVISGGIDAQFRILNSFNPLDVYRKFNISKPYLLYTGGTDYRKNISRLIEAFAKANVQLDYRYQLVTTGVSNPLSQKDLHYQLTLDHLIQTGYVSNEDLISLYNGATLFVFPSLYEGFGLPVLEAMACGTPVLTSNSTSLSEISKDAAYLVDPLNVEQMARSMVYLLQNPNILEEYRKRGLKHVVHFTWEEVGKRVCEEYTKLK